MDTLTLTFLPSATEGNAILSPSGEYAGAYFTLIGGWSDDDQNALGERIAIAVNTRVSLVAAAQAALVAMKLASTLPGVAAEYDFSDAIAAAETALNANGGDHG